MYEYDCCTTVQVLVYIVNNKIKKIRRDVPHCQRLHVQQVYTICNYTNKYVFYIEHDSMMVVIVAITII